MICGSKILVRLIVIALITSLGLFSQLQYHHHDCDGRICIAFPVENDHHHDSDHTHPCSTSHEFVETQQQLINPVLYATDLLMPLLCNVYPDIPSVKIELPYIIVYFSPHLFLPTGRKAPPVLLEL